MAELGEEYRLVVLLEEVYVTAQCGDVGHVAVQRDAVHVVERYAFARKELVEPLDGVVIVLQCAVVQRRGDELQPGLFGQRHQVSPFLGGLCRSHVCLVGEVGLVVCQQELRLGLCLLVGTYGCGVVVVVPGHRQEGHVILRKQGEHGCRRAVGRPVVIPAHTLRNGRYVELRQCKVSAYSALAAA